MTIKACWNHGMVYWPAPSEEHGIAENAILAHIDEGGTLCLEQERNTLVLQPETIPQFIALLKKFEIPPKAKGKRGGGGKSG